MPSVKNSCIECPLHEISEQFTIYTVNESNAQLVEAQSAIQVFAGCEGANLSRCKLINEAAKQYVSSILAGNCDKFMIKEDASLFKK